MVWYEVEKECLGWCEVVGVVLMGWNEEGKVDWGSDVDIVEWHRWY